MRLRFFSVLICYLVSTPLLADEKAKEHEGPWEGKVALGYLATSGNSESSSLNSSFDVSYTSDPWKHAFHAAAIHTSQDNDTTAEAYDAGWQSRRQLSERDYLFGQLSWRKDLFSGYDSQFSQTLGYGRNVIATDTQKLDLQIGVGARQSELRDGGREDDTILQGGLNYVWKFSESGEFHQDFLVESGSSNTYVESVTALSAKLVGNLALVASYTIKNNSDVPPLTEKTDTFAALSLEYKF